MDIDANIRDLRERIASAAERAGRPGDDVFIVAVTKGAQPQDIRAAVTAGIRHVGENRVHEAESKAAHLADLRPHITWHMVGHLQSNKIKTALDVFDIIHSIDSVRVAESVSKRAQDVVPVLLQVNVSGEATKGGFSVVELPQAVERVARLPRLAVKGLMTIAPFTSDPEEVRPVFRTLRELRDSLGLEHLSMGMTDDFEVAVEEGATMVRIGRAIFEGSRP